LPQDYNECRHVPFAVNGLVTEVRESRRETTRIAEVKITVEGRRLGFRAELFCGFQTQSPNHLTGYYTPIVDLGLHSVDDKSLDEYPLIQFGVSQGPPLRLVDTSILYIIRESGGKLQRYKFRVATCS